jgi:hypothetical protein
VVSLLPPPSSSSIHGPKPVKLTIPSTSLNFLRLIVYPNFWYHQKAPNHKWLPNVNNSARKKKIAQADPPLNPEVANSATHITPKPNNICRLLKSLFHLPYHSYTKTCKHDQAFKFSPFFMAYPIS